MKTPSLLILFAVSCFCHPTFASLQENTTTILTTTTAASGKGEPGKEVNELVHDHHPNQKNLSHVEDSHVHKHGDSEEEGESNHEHVGPQAASLENKKATHDDHDVRHRNFHHHDENEPYDLDHAHKHDQQIQPPSTFHLWLYGTASVFLISVLGLMAIMTIPQIATDHHGDILQLLVGLAIGTLTSDALLHLLPHAFSGETHNHDDHARQSSKGSHTQNVYYGLMALTGIIGFLAFERILTIVSDLCSKTHGKTTKVGNCNNRAEKEHSHHHHETLLAPVVPMTEKPIVEEKEKMVVESAIDAVPCMNVVNPDTKGSLTTEQCHRETMVYQHPDPDRGYVIQLMDHHHHHQHQAGSQSGAKSVIYMIVTGDGLHNFFDGLAIGIAFAAGGIGGGISTSVAVLCHELPHEVGDFAVLLKAGLAAKKAIMYNTLSAFLCFIGMTVGILVAKMDTGMLSSIIAGMFLYIALVDMIPQLDCCPTATGTTRAFKLSIQLFGMGIGVSIMSVISIYEPAIQAIMSG